MLHAPKETGMIQDMKRLTTIVGIIGAAIVAAAAGVRSLPERSVTMFVALTGRPTAEDVERKLDALKAGGVDSFMVYPTSGLRLDYLGREFFDVVRAFAEGARCRA